MGGFAKRKVNETHWHAVGPDYATSLLSPWHLRKAGRWGSCPRRADINEGRLQSKL